jgi:carbamoyl-phosphate synthase small subunit
LRDKGAQNGCIMVGGTVREALSRARAFPGLKDADLAKVVSCREPYLWNEGRWPEHAGAPADGLHIVVYDYGVKLNILRMLVDRGCRVTVVPAQSSVESVRSLAPNGVLLSNGPGDPAPCTYAIEAARAHMRDRLPLFGICLGHQILGIAVGGKTLKMKFGHHGANHPVLDLASGRVMITSQNHGFAVDEESLPDHVEVTHRSLFDGSNQGIRVKDALAFSFQGHPEASPGPHDVGPLFDQFVRMIREARQ